MQKRYDEKYNINKDTLEEGQYFQDFSMCSLASLYPHKDIPTMFLLLQFFTSREGQYNIGENLNGIEFKLDNRASDKLHSSIEVARMVKTEKKFKPSGIFGKNNPKFYATGYYDGTKNPKGYLEHRGILFILDCSYLQDIVNLNYKLPVSNETFDYIKRYQFPTKDYEIQQYFNENKGVLLRCFFDIKQPDTNGVKDFIPKLPSDYLSEMGMKKGPNLWAISRYVFIFNDFDVFEKLSRSEEIKPPGVFVNKYHLRNFERYMEAATKDIKKLGRDKCYKLF